MAEYSNADRALAESIIGGLIEGETRGFDLEPGLSISDIQQNTQQFTEQMRILDELRLPCPAMRVGGVSVPASFEELQIPTGSWRPGTPGRVPWFPYWPLELIREVYSKSLDSWTRWGGSESVLTISSKEARLTFKEQAFDFLANRVAAVRSWRSRERLQPWPGISILTMQPVSGALPTATPGCHFTVSTNSSGLRVFWSGAYYISSNNFNSPTTPTTSILQSGVYIFGVDGGAYGNVIQWDQNNVVTLPGHPNYTHLNY
jgi:hypothetical protein